MLQQEANNINRSTVEFKDKRRLIIVTKDKNINRSTVEFKGFVSIARKSSASILIEAQWNLKNKYIPLSALTLGILIEAQWNLKSSG